MRTTVIVASLFAMALACQDASSPERPLIITELAFPASSQFLQVPRSLQLSARGGAATWESSEPSVASVSPSGLVAAKYPGATIITARRGGRVARMSLAVTAASIDVTPAIVQLLVSDTQVLTATVRDADGAVLLGVPIIWSSENERVASVVPQTGVVVGLTPGHTTFVALGGGVKATVSVSVSPPVQTPFAFSSISLGTGANHLCGLQATTGLAYCWGDNHAGALGTGETDGSDYPVLVNGARRFNSLSVAYYATCAVEADTHFAYCWGHNDVGQLGDVNGRPILWEPTLVDNGRVRFRSVSSGGEVTCGIEVDTSLAYCWGHAGLIGDGTTAQRSRPTLVASGKVHFDRISAGPTHVCGIETQTGRAHCWGVNDHGALGDGTTASRLEPVLVGQGTTRFVDISVGAQITCAIEAETALASCWGNNSHGQLGDGTRIDRPLPAVVGGGSIRFVSIDAGREFTCGIEAQTGIGYCWGRNHGGQLGDGTLTDRSVPTMVSAGSVRFTSIDAGVGFGCGVEAKTSFGYCWWSGGLRLVPAPLSIVTSAAAVSR